MVNMTHIENDMNMVYWEPEACSEYRETLEYSLHRTPNSLYLHHLQTREPYSEPYSEPY